MNRANETIQRLVEEDARWHYVDTATPMLGKDGKPRPDLFAKDGLHLNKAGYREWNAVVKRWLERFPKSDS